MFKRSTLKCCRKICYIYVATYIWRVAITNLKLGNKSDMQYILNIRLYAALLFKGKSYCIIAENGDILGFAVVFHRDIEPPLPAKEANSQILDSFVTYLCQ